MRDETVIISIHQRDPEIMNHVINKYSRLLWPIVSAVLKNVGCEQDIEEIVADVFIDLWEHPGKFDSSRGSLKTLLCIIARSRAIDKYREITRHSTVSLDEIAVTSCVGLQERIIQDENRRELLAAVNDLEEPGREILVRRYYFSQKPKEIALALNLPVKQVDNILYRSKRKLKDMLASLQEVSNG